MLARTNRDQLLLLNHLSYVDCISLQSLMNNLQTERICIRHAEWMWNSIEMFNKLNFVECSHSKFIEIIVKALKGLLLILVASEKNRLFIFSS